MRVKKGSFMGWDKLKMGDSPKCKKKPKQTFQRKVQNTNTNTHQHLYTFPLPHAIPTCLKVKQLVVRAPPPPRPLVKPKKVLSHLP